MGAMPASRYAFGSVPWYSVLIVSAIVIGLSLCGHEQKRLKLPADLAIDLALCLIPSAIVGARLYYVAFSWDVFAADPLRILRIWEGGLAIYGGIIGGALTLLVVAKVKKIPATVLLDLAAMAVIIGQFCGRWGNFMNREAHGAVTDCFLKMGLVEANGEVVYYHPTFLYESAWNLIGFIGLHIYSKRRKFDGEMFLLYMAWYGLGRAWIEGLRTDSLYLFSTGIRVSQLLAAVFFVVSAGVIVWVRVKRRPTPETLYVNRRKQAEAEAPQPDTPESENM